MNYTDTKDITNLELFDPDSHSCKIRITSIKDYLSANGGTIYRSHRLSCNQLILISDGCGTLKLDGTRIPLYSQILIPVRSNQVQLFEGNVKIDGYIIIFTDDFLYAGVDSPNGTNIYKIFNSSSSQPVIYLSNTEYNNILVVFKQLELEFEIDQQHNKKDVSRSILNTLILSIERLIPAEQPSSGTSGTDNKLIKSFKNELENNFKSDRQVKSYAERLCITTKKLNNITNSFCGKNAKQVIEERVVLETKRLLMYTDLTIQEISNSLGIDDPTNLVKFFKRHTNFTPAKYRQIHSS